MPIKSLFSDGLEIENEKEKAKRLTKKIAKPKVVSAASIIKSKTVSIPEKLETIYREVDRILGVYRTNTVTITNIDDFRNYINEAIKNGIIAIDTETNNSLDPLTCKLMGLCLYTPGQKNAYIPVNHTDLDDNRLENQITEEQIAEELIKVNGKCKNIFHNAKFDYKVIYCTCGIKLDIYWDTMVGAKILDENERAGLKLQYIQKIDPTIEKYSIDHLFNIQYQYVNPEIFALYAATDSYMTYKLYLYQLLEFEKEENTKIYKLFKEIEVPILTVVASMELDGVGIDTEYAKRLSNKYHKKEDLIKKQINEELNKLSTQIATWRETPEANFHPPKKKGEGVGKSKSEQLSNPIETTSPTQLAILFYDILKVPIVDKDNPRGTGTEILKELADKYELARLLTEQRTILKLLDAFIDALPQMRSVKDNRIHASFNSVGTNTGRFSCTEPNLQQIPSKNLEVRMLFKATEDIETVEFEDAFTIKSYQEVETVEGWKFAKDLTVYDIIKCDNENIYIKNISTINTNVLCIQL